MRDGFANYFACVAVRRRTSSKKFSRRITWFCAFCASAVSTGINATMRLNDVILRGVSLSLLCVIGKQLITHIPFEYYEFYEIYSMNVT